MNRPTLLFGLLLLGTMASGATFENAFVQEVPKHHLYKEHREIESFMSRKVAKKTPLVLEGNRLLEGAGKEKVVFTSDEKILSWASAPDHSVAVGTEDGFFVRRGESGEFEKIYPADVKYSWAPRDVSAIHYSSEGNLWIGCEQGVGKFDGEKWTLFTGVEGLPYNHFTCIASTTGETWFGTQRGAIRFNDEGWAYRARDRWALADRIEDIVIDSTGTVWIACATGVTEIRKVPMTLETKARHFVDQVETYNNRDGFITDWVLKKQGVIESATPKITDNDGQYTAWYGMAMCFRYAVTRDPEAKRLAKRSFEACKRLVDIVPESMRGFPARVLIPVDWHEPVNEQYGPEYNRAKREGDPFWKLITPRFPLSEDGQYRWKNDTSSDELSGHYLMYDLYYDLVTETEEEKEPVRQVVRDITDHLLRNGYNLVDHDGQPTRWARFGPDFMYSPFGWEQRGLNSLMILSFLHVANKITGDEKYLDAANELREKHYYQMNLMEPRPFFPPENIVPWDNGFVVTSFYLLMKNDPNPENRLLYRIGLENGWQFISRQKNAYWNYFYGASCKLFQEMAESRSFEGCFPEAGPWAERKVAELKDFNPDYTGSLETLEKIPLELIAWDQTNSHRLDFESDPMPLADSSTGWSRVDRKAFPIDERCHVRLDRSCFDVDLTEGGEGSGYTLHEGSLFLLPYYTARYLRFIE